MKSLIESVKAMYAPKTEATMMQDDGKMVHNCAKHVEHVQYGAGNCIAEEHADPDRYGNIAWYDIEFSHGIEKGVPISELKVLQAESHGHTTKKAKKVMENDGNLANNAKPYDKVTHGDVITGRLGKDEMGGKKKKPAVKEDTVDEGMMDAAKKIGSAAVKAVTGGNDQDQMKNLQKKMGVPQTGAKPQVKEEMEQVDETVLHKDVEFEINLAEKDYKSYFTAAMKGKDLATMSPEDKKKHFNKVDAGYKAKNEDVFLEAMFDSHINDIIAAHKKAGNRVSDEKSAMSDGKMKHSYVITTPEGKRTRHIHHGSTKKLETMSPAKRSKQSQEQDLEDKD
jgi:hypothetical protein